MKTPTEKIADLIIEEAKSMTSSKLDLVARVYRVSQYVDAHIINFMLEERNKKL